MKNSNNMLRIVDYVDEKEEMDQQEVTLNFNKKIVPQKLGHRQQLM